MSRGEEKQAQLGTAVDAILRTGTSVPSVVDALARILRQMKFVREAELLEEAVNVMMGVPSDVKQIADWFEEQAFKERELLDSDRLRPDARKSAEERWLVYKASAQGVRERVWKKS